MHSTSYSINSDCGSSHASRNADRIEARYTAWVQLSNHILERLQCADVADKLDDIGLSHLEAVNPSTLIFQRNDKRCVNDTAQYFTIDGQHVVDRTPQCPSVIGLSIAAAVKTSGNRSSGAPWEVTWKQHSSESAAAIPREAPAWTDILLNVELRKQKGYKIQPIRSRYDETSATCDIPPCSFSSPGGDELELEEAISDDGRSRSVTPTQESYNKNDRVEGYNSDERPKKRQRSDSRNAVPSGSGDPKTHSQPTDIVSRPSLPVQMAIYAGERFSTSVAVYHTISFLITGELQWANCKSSG